METNGHKPTLAEARAAFEDAEIPAVRPPGDDVLASARAVLGSAIQSPAFAAEALAILAPRDFPRNVHRTVFEAVERLADAGQPVEPASVLSELARTGHLASLHEEGLGHGGVYLHSLMQRAGSVGYHAPRVLDGAHRDRIRAAIQACGALADSDGWDIGTHPDQIRKMVEDATSFAGTVALRPNSDAVTEVLAAVEQRKDPGLTTGWRDLDEAIGGLRPKELIVIGARPGVGKSVVALNIADHVGTRLGLPVLFASIEMTEAELTQRRISAAARVPLHHIVRHQVADADWEKISRAMDRLMDTALHIDDTPSQSLAHIRSQLRTMARTGKEARLLVIDYLGFITAPRAESRQQAVAELARQCKNIAREFAVPVILLAQLNRGPATRQDKRPALTDLRESGEIEQSADIVILLHREDAYEPESPRAGEIDFLVPKNRQGAQCTITLAFQGHYARVVGMAYDDQDPGDWTPSRAAERSA